MVHTVLWALSAALVTAVPTDVAKAAFERGEAALAAGRLDEASAAYREAIVASPDYAAALNGLGSVLFKTGKRDEAVAQFRAATHADPTFKLAFFNLGFAARKGNDFATAAAAYEHYTQLDPSDPDGFYGLGESYRQLGRTEKAVTAYEQYLVLEKRPSEQKWIDKAKGYVAELRPASPPATTGPSAAASRIADGDRLMQDRKYRDALQAYSDAVSADPNNVEAQFKLGTAYGLLGSYADAIDRWGRIAKLTTDPAIRKSAEDNIARAKVKMGQAIASSPAPTPSSPLKAGTAESPAAAGASVAAAPESSRERSRQAYEQGVRQVVAKDYAGAVQSLSQAIQIEPTLSVAFVARGSAYIGLRRFAEAAADYQYALRLDGRFAAPLYGLGEAYRGMGRHSDARDFYEKYVASSATDVRADLKEQARQKAASLH